MKKKKSLKDRILSSLFKHLRNSIIYMTAVAIIFLLIMGSDYSFSLKRASRVSYEMKSTFGKYMKGIKVLDFLAKLF